MFHSEFTSKVERKEKLWLFDSKHKIFILIHLFGTIMFPFGGLCVHIQPIVLILNDLDYYLTRIPKEVQLYNHMLVVLIIEHSLQYMNESKKISLINIDMEWASKLIDVVSKGIGSLSAQFVANQITKSKKYEIKEIAQAIADSKNLPVNVSYHDGVVNITPKDDQVKPAQHPEYRVAEYLIRKETHRLASLEKASLYAAEELKKNTEKGENISDEKLDDSWIAKYFDEVGNIREEKALEYWGRLLAGEIKQPGSYSIRTLNLLANLSRDESELIHHALNHTILVGYPKIKDFKYRENFGFIYSKLKPDGYNRPVLTHYNTEILSSLGILGSSGSIFPLMESHKKDKYYFCGNYGVKFTRKNSEDIAKTIKSGEVRLLTRVGLELLGLHTFEDNEKYFLSFADHAARSNLSYTIFSDIYIEKKSIKFRNVIKEYEQDPANS